MRPLGNYAFGEDLGSVPTRYNPYRYAASYRDQESAGEYRYYMTARYHDTEYGRFTQADYWEPGFLTPQALTPLAYQYVGNNPLIYNDPTGHLCWGCLRRAVVVTGIVVTASLVASTGLLAIVGGGMTLNFMEDSRVLFRVTSDGTANTLVDLATNGTYTSTTQWYHVVATYDGATATARLCVNGVNDGTLTSAPSAIFGGAIDVAVSGYDTTGSSPFNGVIDEVRIYSRALSASEVQARYLAQPENEDTLHYYLGGKQVAFKKGGTLYFPLQDHLKGTAVITNSAGSVMESTTYYPYGQTRSGGITSTDRAFTGQRLDSTGLYYYGARYYDPSIGRFVSSDKLIPELANPQSFNRYTYVYDNPLRYTDPNGECIGPLARYCRKAAQLTVDAGKAVVATAARVTKQEITRQGEAKVAEMQAEQAASKEVGGAMAGVGKVVAEVAAYQGPVLAPVPPETGPNPFLVLPPKAAIEAEAQALDLAAGLLAVGGPLGDAAEQSGAIQVGQAAAPLVQIAPQVVPLVGFFYAAVTGFGPPLLRDSADFLEELSQGMDQPSDDVSYNSSYDYWYAQYAGDYDIWYAAYN